MENMTLLPPNWKWVVVWEYTVTCLGNYIRGMAGSRVSINASRHCFCLPLYRFARMKLHRYLHFVIIGPPCLCHRTVVAACGMHSVSPATLYSWDSLPTLHAPGTAGEIKSPPQLFHPSLIPTLSAPFQFLIPGHKSGHSLLHLQLHSFGADWSPVLLPHLQNLLQILLFWYLVVQVHLWLSDRVLG